MKKPKEWSCSWNFKEKNVDKTFVFKLILNNLNFGKAI